MRRLLWWSEGKAGWTALRDKMPSPARRAAIFGLLGSLAIVLSILENSVTGMLNFAVPGLKPGLANLAVVLALPYLGGGAALAVSLLKALAVFLATGTVTTLWFSLAGSLLSVAGMWLLWRFCRRTFSMAGISALGGALSNLGQVGVMAAISNTPAFFYYLPALAIFGVGFGMLVGVLGNMVLRRVPRERMLGQAEKGGV